MQQQRTKLDLSIPEPRLIKAVDKLLSADFTLMPEVWGTYLVDHTSRVRIDFIAFASPRLVELGFTPDPIGIEVKSPASKTISGYELAWQTITYANSEFNGQRPAFILVFPAWKYFFTEDQAITVRALTQFANVGELQIGEYAETWTRYQMNFGPSVYYRSDAGVGPQPNAALKRRVGNC